MFKVYDSMDWGVCIHPWNHPQSQDNEQICVLQSFLSYPFPPSSLHPHPQTDFSVIIDECASHRILYKQTHTVCILCLSCSAWKILNAVIIVHSTVLLSPAHMDYKSTCWWTFVFFFQLLTITNKAALKFWVRSLYEHMLSFLLGKHLGREWRVRMVGLCLAF